jgi:eukaryotic-like serine/threonine-protein kinase
MRDGPIRSTPGSEPPPVDPLLGRVIAGKFAVNERLGAGAMGIVYRATQTLLERTVAIKVLHREFAADAQFADRFWREAKAASRLDHPNSIRVLDFGQESDGLLYLAMEYVEGDDLFDWKAQRGPLAPKTIVELLSQVLAALAVAHDMGVVHRDLKPENIMIVRGMSDEGRAIDIVKVCDFGIAKILDSSRESGHEPQRKHSTTGLVVGTPAYMSPEQARGERQDARSDLYAVGVVLYELLAGRVPFEAESLLGVALKHVSERPERPSSRAAGVEPGLEAICLKAMSKTPSDRYQTAREMRLALQQVASQLGFAGSLSPSSAGSVRPPMPQARHDSSKPTLTGVTPGTPAPRAKRSGAWLALLLVPVLGALLAFRFRGALSDDHAAVEPALSAAPSAPLEAASLATPTAQPTDSNSADVPSSDAPHPGFGAKHHHFEGDRPPHAAAVEERPANDALVTALPATQTANNEPPPSPPDSRSLVPVAPTPPPAPSPATPSAPSFDLSLARVSIGSARNAVGATALSVTRAVSEAASRITACYKSALPQLGGSQEGADVLHVDTDGAGVITDARLSGPVRGSVASCVAAAVQGHRVANVDTGNASADVPLSFRAH